jgi:hypothetical protein
MISYNNYIKRLSNIKSDNHYLKKTCPIYDEYIAGLYSALKNLCQVIGEKSIIDFINKKLQFDISNFNEAQYIQSACELSIMSYFSSNSDLKFEYEKKITPPKDVDFSICKNGINYNVEIKCASYKDKKQTDENQVLITFTNRIPNKDSMLECVKQRLSPHGKEVIEEKNRDNNLKDFLLNAQSKFNNASNNDVNILIVCCDDQADMYIWKEYLFNYGGFFTEESPVKHEEFEKVDYVLITNLFHRHDKYYTDVTLSNLWSLSHSFCLLYPNRYSLRNRNFIGYGIEDVRQLSTIFPNFSEEFVNYMDDDNDLPEGESIETKKSVAGILFFIDKYHKNKCYFKPTPKTTK